MEKQKKKPNVTLFLDPETKKRLENYKKDKNTRFQYVVEKLIVDFLDKEGY